MQIISTVSEMQALAASQRRSGKTVGFVPTMGFLHEGHLSLLQRARRDCDTVVASIFVNPAQFGPHEDFDRYPRDERGDRDKCLAAGVDILFMPSVADMYPAPGAVFISVEGVSDILEGAVRPGHFRGVATVVAKLLNLVRPHKMFLGQKDYQQCVVLRRMVIGLNIDTQLIVLPTLRETDGLAMSSRNSYLGADDRTAAAVIHRALEAAQELFAEGVLKSEKVLERALSVLQKERRVSVDYAVIVDPDTLEPREDLHGTTALLIAVRCGGVRLIDNILLTNR
jgi:pantoate--beta-alanine ligase